MKSDNLGAKKHSHGRTNQSMDELEDFQKLLKSLFTAISGARSGNAKNF